jgi:hypothetical protein
MLDPNIERTFNLPIARVRQAVANAPFYDGGCFAEFP